MFKAAVGRSQNLDTIAAGREAVREACLGLGGVEPGLLLVFATAGYHHANLLEVLQKEAPDCKIAGCSAEGVITQGRSDEVDCALAVLALGGDELSFETFLMEGYSANSVQAGQELATKIEPLVGDALCLLVFPDGLAGDCTAFLRALDERFPELLVVGGASGDALRMEKTFQYSGASVASGAAAAVLIRGRGRAEIVVSHGCEPIGRRMKIKEERGWLLELDGLPAWDVFKGYLDGDPQDLNADGIMHLCIGFPLPESSSEYPPYIMRSPMLLRKEDGALFFPGGGLRTGDAVRMVRRDGPRMRESAISAANKIRNAVKEPPQLVLQFDCAGRGRLLFGSDAAQELVVPLQESLGTDIPWIGFHTYGEISPLTTRAYYHNYTVVLLALYGQNHE